MQGGIRFNSIGTELRREFGRRTVKLSIDAGFTCPNRDGTCGYGGCAFCSGGGSGELAAHRQSVSDSISEQIALLSEKWPDAAYIAYFQSHTNTYAPVDVLRRLYREALDDPRLRDFGKAHVHGLEHGKQDEDRYQGQCRQHPEVSLKPCDAGFLSDSCIHSFTPFIRPENGRREAFSPEKS